MSNNTLTIELEILDDKGNAKLKTFVSNVENSADKINQAGKNINLSKPFISDLDRAEARAKNFSSAVNQIFGLISFGAVVNAFTSATKTAFDAERANRQLSASATQAGLAYQFLNEKAREFADEGGLSQTAANRTEGLIAKLAQAAGRPQDLDKIETALLNTASARGLQVSQLETLVNAVISGSSDEPLNNAGLADPGKLAKDYADSLGKSTDALTKQEQVLSRFLPLMQQAEILTGANAERMASLSGQAETASARLEDLEVKFGKGITSSLEFRDALSFANDILKEISVTTDEVQKKLAQGLTPRQIAEEEANKKGNKIIDSVKTGLTAPYALFSYPYDLITEDFETANNRFLEVFTGGTKRRIDAMEEAIAAEQKLLEKQNQAAEKQKIFLNLQTFEDQEKTRQEQEKKNLEDRRKEFDKRFSNLGGLNNLQQNRQLLGELQQNRELFTPEEYARKIYDTQEKINQIIEQGFKKIEEYGKNAASVINDTFSNLARNNPIAQTFLEGQKAVDALNEKLKETPEHLKYIVENALNVQKQLNAENLFASRIDNNLAAFDLRERADKFRNAGNTGAYKKLFDDAVNGDISRGNFFNGQFGTYGSFLANKVGGADKLTDAQRRDIYEVNQLKNLSTFDSANFGVNDNSLISRIARERAFGSGGDENLSLNQKLEKQFAIIYGGAGSDEEKAIADRKVIGLTSALDPSKISDNLREKIISANLSEAQRKSEYEKEDLKLRREEKAAIENLTTALNGLKELAKNGENVTSKQIIEIVDRSNGRANVRGAKPTPSSMNNTYPVLGYSGTPEDTARGYSQ